MESNLPKVVSVIDKRTVVLNRGERDSIKIGHKFLIFGLGDDIIDPDTAENLGQIELVRGQVIVTHVQEKLATAHSAEFELVPKQKRTLEGGYGIRRMFNEREIIEYDETREEKDLREVTTGDFARPI